MAEDDIAFIKRKLELIENLLIGDISNYEKPGVIERLKTLEDHSKCIKRFSWITISTISGLILTALVKLIMK